MSIVTSWRGITEETDWFETETAGIRIFWIPVEYSNRLSFTKRIIAFLKFAICAGSKTASIPADIIFATSTPLTIVLPGVWASSRLRIPLILEIRDLWPEAPIALGVLKNRISIWMARFLESWAYRNASHIVTLSPAMTLGVAKVCRSAQITEIPNFADLDRFSLDKLKERKFRDSRPELGGSPLVIYAGTLGLVNNVSLLPRIANEALLLNKDIKFVIVGEGNEGEKIHALAVELGVLGVNFFMYPSVAKSIMPNVLASADLSLSLVANIPELWGNSANKFFDALASGTPIGINHLGWQADLIEANAIGIVFSPDDPAEGAKKIVQFISNKERVEQAGISAKSLARSQFNVDDQVQKLNSVFLNALER